MTTEPLVQQVAASLEYNDSSDLADLLSDNEDDEEKKDKSYSKRLSMASVSSSKAFKKVMTPIKFAKKLGKDALTGASSHNKKKLKEAIAGLELEEPDTTAPAPAVELLEASLTFPEPESQPDTSGPPVTRVGRANSRDSTARSRSQSRQRNRRDHRRTSSADSSSGDGKRGSSVKPRRGGRRPSVGSKSPQNSFTNNEASNRSKSKRTQGEQKERGRRPPGRSSSGYQKRGESVDRRGRGRSQSVARKSSRARSSSRAKTKMVKQPSFSSLTASKAAEMQANNTASFSSLTALKAREEAEKGNTAFNPRASYTSIQSEETPMTPKTGFSISRSGSARDLLAKVAASVEGGTPVRQSSGRNLIAPSGKGSTRARNLTPTIARQGSGSAKSRTKRVDTAPTIARQGSGTGSVKARTKRDTSPKAPRRTDVAPKTPTKTHNDSPSSGTDATVLLDSEHCDDEEADEIDDSEGEDAPASVGRIDPQLLARAREVERRLAREKKMKGKPHSSHSITSTFSTASSTSRSHSSRNPTAVAAANAPVLALSPHPNVSASRSNRNSKSPAKMRPISNHNNNEAHHNASRSNRNSKSPAKTTPIRNNSHNASRSNRNSKSPTKTTPPTTTPTHNNNNNEKEKEGWTCCCGEPNKDAFNFCGVCGGKRIVQEPKTWDCASCGRADNELRFKFCVGCGTKR